jgi:hypothetical protein
MPRSSAAPNAEILEAALQGLETQKQKIDEQISQVRSLMGRRVGRPPKSAGSSGGSTGGGGGATKKASGAGYSGGRRKKRVLSAEARKRIAAAQKKRWAAFRKTQE